MSEIYDYIVVGGGIAGLYSNYILSKNKKGILLEKEDYFGGRVLEKEFHGAMLKLGAGIVTAENKKILKLIDKLKIEKHAFVSSLTSLLPKKFNMKVAVEKIIKMYKKEKNNIKEMNVEQFLLKYFGKEFTKDFIANCEYHDFLKSDIMYFIKYYKIKDMIHQNDTIYGLRWTDLVNKLVKDNCHKNSIVTKVTKDTKDNNIFNISVNNTIYKTKKVIFAVTLKPLDKLLKGLIDFSYSDYIGAVPYIRIYTYHSKKIQRGKLGGFNLVPNVLYKIIPYTDNIMMTSYADSKDAITLGKLMELKKSEQIKQVQKLLDDLEEYGVAKNKIDDILIHYWPEGVHYYKPFGNKDYKEVLKKLRNPIKGIKVIGEMVSLNHGYVEGAISYS